MNPYVKVFIEDNIQLIDAGNFLALFLKCYDECTDDNMLELQHILYKAGFDIKEDRDLALLQILTEKVQQFATPFAGVSQMPLNEFLWGYLNNHFGVGYGYIEEFMIQHKDEWKNYVNIFEENGKNVIQRKN